jgi:diguanylate cyclase (GGDEF)-like protein
MFAPSVFVIDDERSILNSIARLLRGAPLTLHGFSDPEEALRAAESDPPVTIVSDYRMPVMDGIRLLELFKQARPEATRVLLTGFVDLEAAVGAINRGSVLRFLKKPWNDEELRTTVLSSMAAAVMGKAAKAMPPFFERLIASRSEEEALQALTGFLGEESGLMLAPPVIAKRPAEMDSGTGLSFSIPADRSGGSFIEAQVPANEAAAFEAAGLGPALADLVESALGGLRLALGSIEARADLVELSERDQLSGLFNRRAMMSRLEAACSDKRRIDRPFSILLLDIDDFKEINDRYGHGTGDAAIAGIGKAIMASCRERDIPARIGGDEFLIGLPATGGEGAAALASRIQESAALAGERFGLERGLRLSIGIAVATEAFRIETILEAADNSMYSVKRSGKNAVGKPQAL